MGYKNVLLLVKVFSSLSVKERNGWTLSIYGDGPLLKDLQQYTSEYVRVYGFVQPKELSSIVKQHGFFLLLSELEHWGVAVHEAAIAGLPILVSKGVVAGDKFVDTRNGYVINPSSFELKSTLKKICQQKDSELLTMSEHSLKISHKPDYNYWIRQLMSTLEK